MSNASHGSSHHVHPHVPVLARVHELAADADVRAAEQDHPRRHEGPEHQKLLSSIWRKVHHHKLVIIFVVIAIV